AHPTRMSARPAWAWRDGGSTWPPDYERALNSWKTRARGGDQPAQLARADRGGARSVFAPQYGGGKVDPSVTSAPSAAAEPVAPGYEIDSVLGCELQLERVIARFESATNHQPPTTNYLLPTTNHLLPQI